MAEQVPAKWEDLKENLVKACEVLAGMARSQMPSFPSNEMLLEVGRRAGMIFTAEQIQRTLGKRKRGAK